MPTIHTPPPTDKLRDRRPEINDGDNGGRRPPTDKRTGGNGDGDNWDGEPSGRRGPRERISVARIGVMLTLFAVVMIFVALAVAFVVTRVNGTTDAHGQYVKLWQPTAVPPILLLNTVVLLLSSLAAEFARRSMFREHELMEEWLGLGRPISRRATVWLSVTLGFGVAFLAGQCVAWKQLVDHHITYRHNPSATFFYLLTATHAAHLLLGITALAGTLIVLQRSRKLGTRQVWVDSTVWYWHAMGLLWLALYALLEFGQ